MKPDEIQVRRDICKDCTRACDVRDSINHADPCAACPLRVWHAMGDCERDQTDRMRGFGDAIHVVALPIARILRLPCVDSATKQLRPDSPCAGRVTALNKAMPFGKQPMENHPPT